MDARIKYWENVILSGRHLEPRTDIEKANFQIAEFLISQKKEEIA